MYISPYSIKSGKSELKFKNSRSLTLTSDCIKTSSGDIISTKIINNDPLILNSSRILDNNIEIFPNPNIGQSNSDVFVYGSSIEGILPDPPTNIQVSRGEGQITVSFNAPLFSGGSDIKNYTVVGNFGDRKVSRNSSPIIVDSLTNGESYHFQVYSTNDTGDSVLSLKSQNIIPATEPNSPVITLAVPGNTFVNLEWSKPWNGGSKLLHYNIYVDDIFNKKIDIDYSSPEKELESLKTTVSRIKGNPLTNGTSYKFTVTAVNDVREGKNSEKVDAIPITFPESPVITSTVTGNTFVNLEWSKPWNGGSKLLHYNIYVDDVFNKKIIIDYYSPEKELESLKTTISSIDGKPLSNGTSYKFTITAINAVDEGPKSDFVTAIPITFPESPVLTSAVDGNQSIILTWSEPWNGGTTITSYKVYVDGILNKTIPYIKTSDSKHSTTVSTIYDIDGNVLNPLINGSSYQFTVSAINAVDEGPKSSSLTGYPSTVPSAPSLTTTPSNKKITADWTIPDNGGSSILGYKIYLDNQLYSTINDPTKTTKLIDILNGNTLDNGVTYAVNVKAFNRMGDGNLSESSKSKPVTVPGAPIISSLAFGNTTVKVVWSAPKDGGDPIDSYNIYYREPVSLSTPYPETKKIENISETKREYLVENLKNGVQYTFWMSAVDSYVEGALESTFPGEGPKSEPSYCIPSTVPDAPVLQSATPFFRKINVKWDEPVDNGGDAVKKYMIYYYSNNDVNKIYSIEVESDVREYNIEKLDDIEIPLLDNTNYTVYVTAKNKAGESSSSNVLVKRTATFPKPPSYLEATPDNKLITLVWNDVTDNGGDPIYRYSIYKQIENNEKTLLTYVDSPTLHHPITNLENGTSYKFYVYSVNRVGESLTSKEVTSIPRTVPNAPTGFSGSPKDTSVSLTWNAVIGVTNNGGNDVKKYNVYKRLTSEDESKNEKVKDVIVTDHSTSYSCDVTGLINGTSYRFQVSAVNESGEGAKSAYQDIIPYTTPNALSSISAVRDSSQTVKISWNALVGKTNTGGKAVTKYNLYKRQTSDPVFSDTLIKSFIAGQNDTSLTSYSHTESGLSNGTSYTFSVTSTNDNVNESTKATASATPYTIPDPPSGLSSISGNGYVQLRWSTPSNGGSSITGYDIVYGSNTVSVDPYTLYKEITGLTNGTSYTFKIYAKNAAGSSAGANFPSVTPMTVPSAPTITSCIVSNGYDCTLSWNAPYNGGSNITFYKVYINENLVKSNITSTSTNITLSNGYYSSFTLSTEYYINVSAVNSVAEGPLSSITYCQVPDATPIDEAVAGDGIVTLYWTNNSTIHSGYKIYVNDNYNQTVLVDLSNGNSYSAIIPNLTNGTSYKFTLYSYYDQNISAPSVPVTVKAGFATPTNFTGYVNGVKPYWKAYWTGPTNSGNNDPSVILTYAISGWSNSRQQNVTYTGTLSSQGQIIGYWSIAAGPNDLIATSVTFTATNTSGSSLTINVPIL